MGIKNQVFRIQIQSTGNNYAPYQQNITYNGEYEGQKMIGGH